MTLLRFSIDFHSGFRVGGAYARDGIHSAATGTDPLPADSLKGVMRAAANELLGERHPLVGQVFGTPRTPAAWAWTRARPVGSGTWETTLRHRVSIDPEELAALKDHVVLGEQLWASRAQFDIELVRHLDVEAERLHAALLRVSAGCVHGLGAWRRRGLGWVQMRPEQGAVDAEDVRLVLGQASAASAVPAGGSQ